MAKKSGSKQKKMNARVDFTPMVDMIMLLVTFFMLCTTLLKPQTMQITMPSDKDDLKDEQRNQAKASAPGFLPYARVLGFRRESSPLLKAIKQNCRIPLITKLADASSLLDESGLKLLEETVFASNLYEALLSLLQPSTNISVTSSS